MKEMDYKKKKKLTSYLLLVWAVCLMVFVAGCSDDNDPEIPEIPEPELPAHVRYEILKEYSFNDLKQLENDFIEANGISAGLFSIVKEPKYEGSVQLRVYKVMLEVDHTDGSAAKMNLSGLLIAPPMEEGRSYRQVITPPYTYILNKDAPTQRVKNGNLEPNLIFWLLEAFNYGYAVMTPDFPGFGDSYGQGFIPYVEKAPMVRTTLAFIEASQAILKKEKYGLKDGFIISGYSLGAFVSLQVAREIETNSAYQDMAVDLLIVGGAPCNLLQEADLIRASEFMPQPYLFPLALMGYKKNGYPHLEVSDFLNEPYATQTSTYLDGVHDDFDDFFPTETALLFTTNFIYNEQMEDVNHILDENSVKPWKNKCKFIMTHGRADETVYFAQAKDFSVAHNAAGGQVTFAETEGNHTGAGQSYFLRLLMEIGNYQ